MKVSLLLCSLFIASFGLRAQTFELDPAFPTADAPLTLTVDATGTSLEGHSGDVWIWAWLPDLSPEFDAPTNVNPATSAQDAAKATRSGSNPDEYSITFTPTTFFGKSASEITRIGFKFKSQDWGDNKQTDVNLFFDINTGDELNVTFSEPNEAFQFIELNESVSITANASKSVALELFFNEVSVATANGTEISYSQTISTSGTTVVKVVASEGGSTVSKELNIIVRDVLNASKPAGVIQGINYSGNDTQATFCLYAPLKTSVYLVGDFNDWLPSTEYQLAKDGDYFWVMVDELTPGTEYAFQYLVDEELLIGDPYSDKILDPNNDDFIPETVYPSLISYPDSDVPDGWVSVMQTGQTPFDWTVTDFEAPANEDLVIYELLVRDFDEGHSYQAIIDRLDYLEELGVNAIQLMPIMEFDGNLSWGYNPAYFFAVDKYYGTKDDLKAFIDECHSRGMAVILDMVLNHTHERNPIAAMYWDQANFRPAANNPWLNQQATHPFNVFFDFNHESQDTKNFMDTVNYYWLEEYRFDGFRFDLSKGFTQTVSGDNVGLWGQYDQSRVDILERMADDIWSHHPDAYVILEHLSDNSEETVLANYGMMLWGNMNHNFNQNTMGFSNDSQLDWAYFATRGWNDPNLISYMESHDEERLIYRNLQFGGATGGYSTKDLNIALDRVKSASAIYYAIPGPKMLWQFGELGYDISIDQNGRTGNKPIPWADASEGLGYDADQDRQKLYKVTSEIMRLKANSNAFSNATFTLDESSQLIKQITLNTGNTSPTTTEASNFVIIANFNLNARNEDVEFPHTGTWFNYFANAESLEVTGSSMQLMIQPGEFRIYTDVEFDKTESELTNYVQPLVATNLSGSEIDNEGVQLTWIDNSTIETGFSIYRRHEGEEFELIGTNGVNQATFLDIEVEPNTTYEYRVDTRNANYSIESEILEITTTEVITSLSDVLSEQLRFYPNPVTDKLFLEGENINEVSISDFSGREVMNYTNVSGFVAISSLPTGIYLLKVKVDGQVLSTRIIKK